MVQACHTGGRSFQPYSAGSNWRKTLASSVCDEALVAQRYSVFNQRICRAWPVLFVALLFAVTHRAVADPVTIQVPIGNVQHVDELGSVNNTVLYVSLPGNAVVTGIGWSGTLTTFGKSWADDADIALSNLGQEPSAIITPGEDDGPVPDGQFYASGGIIPLGELGFPGIWVSSEVLAIEFAESIVDVPGAVEAVWSSGSFLTIQYELIGPTPCVGDLNGDTIVNVSDLLILLGQWGMCPDPKACQGDLNGDGTVNVSDLLILLGNWGQCPDAVIASACCFEDGSCENLTADQCASQDGSYQGDFTNCETWSCTQPPDGSSCAQAITVEVDGPPIIGDSTGHTPADDLPFCEVAGSPSSSTGIFWFNVEGNGSVLTATTCNSKLGDTRIAVYCSLTCAITDLSCITSSIDGCEFTLQSSVSWCTQPGQLYRVAVWSAPNLSGEIEMEVTSGATCSDAERCPLPCDGFCGIQTPSGCWCDEGLCDQFGDCCPGLCESCPNQPSCDNCPEVTCPKGSTDENEPCGEDFNGGCNTDPINPPHDPISCGETICGTLWASQGLRDTDWYQIDLTGQSSAVEISIQVDADVDIAAFILEDGCPDEWIVTDNGCSATMTVCLEPGLYSLVIVPELLSGLPCSSGPHRYTVTMNCGPSCGANDSCQGNCGGFAPAGCACDEWCVFLGDCCDDACAECPGISGC
jgi:hypothetical protein